MFIYSTSKYLFNIYYALIEIEQALELDRSSNPNCASYELVNVFKPDFPCP